MMRHAFLIFAVVLVLAVALRSADELASPAAAPPATQAAPSPEPLAGAQPAEPTTQPTAQATQPAAPEAATQPAGEEPATRPAGEEPATQPVATQPSPSNPPVEPSRPAERSVLTPGPAPATSDRSTSPSARTPAPSARGPSYDDYRLISERNIFSRDRTSRTRTYTRSEPTSRPAPPAPPPAPPASPGDTVWVLAGVALHREAQVAFLENLQTGEVLRLSPGSAAASGTIASICLDSVEYSRGATTRTIRVGENLAGEVPTSFTVARSSLAPASPSSGAASSSSTTQPATTSDPGVNSILERLRQRRLQEMQK